jgi:acetyl-CoA carboxylase biotin carboxylase subunit
VPVLAGTLKGVSGFDEAREVAARIGYPVMLKASAGGGGKGMRRVDSEAALSAALRDASSEADALSATAKFTSRSWSRNRGTSKSRS